MPRLDQEILNRKLATSRARAQSAIAQGFVRVNNSLAQKPSMKVAPEDAIEVNDPTSDWVSRAALKIWDILEDHQDAIALDLGASTGGFTQALLRKGAAQVFAIDVGHGQLHESLANDPRILLREGLNVKDLDEASFEHPNWPHFNIITSDLSFISLKKALPQALNLAQQGTLAYLLIKPQFELDPSKIGKGGIVKSESDAQMAVQDIRAWLEAQNWQILSLTPSPIKGGDGNQEYVLKAKKL